MQILGSRRPDVILALLLWLLTLRYAICLAVWGNAKAIPCNSGSHFDKVNQVHDDICSISLKIHDLQATNLLRDATGKVRARFHITATWFKSC